MQKFFRQEPLGQTLPAGSGNPAGAFSENFNGQIGRLRTWNVREQLLV
jgi:hypothetical protein